MNALWFMGVGFGALAGWWLKCLVSAVQDLRDARQARIGELLVGLLPPPTHPACVAAPTSAAALAAWERGR